MMKAWKMLVLIAIAALIVGTAPVFAGGSQETKTFKMRATTPLAKSGSVGKGLDKLSELVASKSNGRITTTTNYAGELGTQREQVEMVRDGSLEVVTTLASGTAAFVPQLALFEFPYIYKDEAHLVRVLDAMEAEVSKLLAPHNFIAVGGQNMGFRHMLNKKRAIETVADMKGLKMRGPNPVYVGMFNALGASGTTTDWSEIYSAIQTGVIDGLEASPDMLFSMKFHEAAPYMSKTGHIAACVYYMFRKNWVESLPEDLKKGRPGLGEAGRGLPERTRRQGAGRIPPEDGERRPQGERGEGRRRIRQDPRNLQGELREGQGTGLAGSLRKNQRGEITAGQPVPRPFRAAGPLFKNNWRKTPVSCKVEQTRGQEDIS